MDIIPVIDISQGYVVHAVKGQRQYYQPLCTSLSKGNCADDIVRAFLDFYPFNTIYIADIDAIEGRANNRHIIEQLHRSFPSLNFWIDQGISSSKEIAQDCSWQHVIGSETHISAAELRQIIKRMPDIILSLDFGTKFLGDQKLLDNTAQWSERIIIMSLEHISSDRGPDYQRICKFQKSADDRKVYVAGGVRDEVDLQALNDIGIAGVLVATALHTQKLTPAMLNKFCKKIPCKTGY